MAEGRTYRYRHGWIPLRPGVPDRRGKAARSAGNSGGATVTSIDRFRAAAAKTRASNALPSDAERAHRRAGGSVNRSNLEKLGDYGPGHRETALKTMSDDDLRDVIAARDTPGLPARQGEQAAQVAEQELNRRNRKPAAASTLDRARAGAARAQVSPQLRRAQAGAARATEPRIVAVGPADRPGARAANRIGALDGQKQRRDYAAKLSDSELRATDRELTRRAALLGKPGKVGAQHKVIRTEIARRTVAARPKPPTELSVPITGARSGPRITTTTKGSGVSGFAGKQAPPFGKTTPGAPGKASDGAAKSDRPNPFAKNSSPAAKPPGKPAAGGSKAIRDMVAAYAAVPLDKRDEYRKRVIGKAREAGAMTLIPDAWLRGKPGKPAGAGGKADA